MKLANIKQIVESCGIILPQSHLRGDKLCTAQGDSVCTLADCELSLPPNRFDAMPSHTLLIASFRIFTLWVGILALSIFAFSVTPSFKLPAVDDSPCAIDTYESSLPPLCEETRDDGLDDQDPGEEEPGEEEPGEEPGLLDTHAESNTLIVDASQVLAKAKKRSDTLSTPHLGSEGPPPEIC